MKNFFISILLILGIISFFYFKNNQNTTIKPEQKALEIIADQTNSELAEMIDEFKEEPISIQIEYLQKKQYPGSELKIEETLSPGSNYKRYIASYDSEGLKQYGLLTIPDQEVPEEGFPAIIFNHGYIAPEEYKTTERYVAYTDYFSRNGYVLFRPDYRGHDKSEGEAKGGYGNSDYIIDVLNAYSSVEKLKEVNKDKIGMWGHSMGGWITHRAMVVNPNIKAGVIWAGVVGGYDDLLELWKPYWVRRGLPEPEPDENNPRRRWRSYLVEEYGSPNENPKFWASISAVSYLENLSGPIQLHHATGDVSVPSTLADRFYENLKKYSEKSESYTYQGDDHNITANFNVAMKRSLDFFDKYLKIENE